MSTPPNMPPQGGDFSQVGQGGQQQWGQPGMGQQPLPPAKRSNVWLWVLGGCFGLVLIGAVGVMVLGYIGVKTVQERTGLNTEDMEKRPAFAAAKLITALNPEIELVSADEESQRITIREKSTGKTVTVTLDELKEGRITFTDSEGEEFKIEASGEGGNGSLRMKTGDGETVFSAEGGKTPEFPSWVPVPSGTFTGAQKMTTNELRMVSGTLKTDQSIEEFADWLENEMKGRGFTVSMKNITSNSSGEGIMFSATSSDKKQTVTAMGGKKAGEPAEILFSTQEKP